MSNVNYRLELEIIFNSTSLKEEEKEKAILDSREKAREYLESKRKENSCGKELKLARRCDFAALQFPKSQKGRANDLQPVR